jgi:hypothetical protein
MCTCETIERLAALVEAERLAVLRQLLLHLQPRRREEIAQRVFVFVAVEPPLQRAAFAREGFLLDTGQRRRQPAEKRAQFGRIGPLLLLRRHLAGLEPVVNFDPGEKVRGVGRAQLSAR